MRLDPPLLTRGPLSDRVYVVTHGKVVPHPTREGQTMVMASVKYDVTDQFEALVKVERQAVLDCVNLYGDETLHKALDSIGWFPRASA